GPARRPDADDALGVLPWLLVRRRVDEPVRIEQHEIGPQARRDPPAVPKPDPRGRPRRQPGDRLLDRHEPFANRESPQKAGRGPVEPRMRLDPEDRIRPDE